MNSSLENQAAQGLKSWVRDDSFVCAIHISSGDYSQEFIIEVLGKYVKAKLNKYLVGRQWKKLHNSNHLQIFWFKEGVDIRNKSDKGYFIGSGYINKEVRLKSTDVQSHYHCLVKCGVDVKNTKIMGVDFKNDIANLVELTLKQIFKEYAYSRAEKTLKYRQQYLRQFNDQKRIEKQREIIAAFALDVKIRNCHEDDFAQQSYALKEFKASEGAFNKDKDSLWGIL